MVNIDSNFLREKLDLINSPHYRDLRQKDFERFQIFNGNLEPSLFKAVHAEFSKPETIEDLINRIVPINILKKIILKLAGVYIEQPYRTASNKDELDQEFINAIEDSSNLNIVMKESNRYFKLYKRNLMEPYVDKNGKIKIRNLPRHTYEVFSHSSLSKNVPDTVVKILNDDKDPNKQRFAFWTDEQFLIVNGKGEYQVREMEYLNNPAGINPYGKLPFVYINEASYDVNPIQNDDLLRMSVLIPLLLTDLCFASKYQTWSLITVIGYDGDIPASPNSVLSLPYGPDGEEPKISTIKPEFSTNEALELIQSLLDITLTTNNLTTSAFGGKLNASNLQSGVAKALDSSESIEDKKDQQAIFLNAEDHLWSLLKSNLIPVWRKNNILASQLNREFSKDFEVNVILREPKVIMSERDQIEVSKMKLDNGFSTLKRELSVLYPALTSDEVEELEREIIEERGQYIEAKGIVEKETNMVEMEDEEDDDDTLNQEG